MFVNKYSYDYEAIYRHPYNNQSIITDRARGGDRSKGGDRAKDSTRTKRLETKTIDVPKTIDIVAWYTPQIPVSHGPAEFGGLPGLILELKVVQV